MATKKQAREMEERGNNRRATLAMVISIVSASFTGVTLWFNTLSPAGIKASLSSPQLQYEHDSSQRPPPKLPGVTVSPSRDTLGLVATCAFANNGARIGEISNLAVEFVADDGTKWTFLPYKVLDDLPASSENRDVGRLWMKGRDFSPILIPGRQTAQHTFLFLAHEFENLASHNFHVKLFIWLAGEKTPHEQQLSTLDFNPAVVSTLKTGSMQTVPFEEEKELINGLK
jgi:hypothetical protein